MFNVKVICKHIYETKSILFILCMNTRQLTCGDLIVQSTPMNTKLSSIKRLLAQKLSTISF